MQVRLAIFTTDPEEELQMTTEDQTKVCPYCGESIKQVATVCRYCHSQLDGSQASITEHADSSIPAAVSSRPVSLKRISAALLALSAIGGGAGYWYLRQNPGCQDGVATVQEILLENAFKPFEAEQRSAIQQFVSITVGNVSQKGRSEEGRLCSATISFSSKDGKFGKFVDFNIQYPFLRGGMFDVGNEASASQLSGLWDVVAHKMDAAIEFNIKREDDGIVVVARGPALFIAEPLLKVANNYARQLSINRRIENEQQRSESANTRTVPAQPEASASRTDEKSEVTTPMGTATVSEDNVLLLNGQPTVPVVKGDFSLSIERHTAFRGGYALLLMNDSGGTACPAQYRWVLLDATRGLVASPEFGTCSDSVDVSQADNSLMVTMPKADGRSVMYAFDGTTVFEDGRALRQQ